MREKVILICTQCLSRNYTTTKQKTQPRLEIKKYCPKCNAQTLHKESKQEVTMGKTKKYLQGVVKEGKRVRWPSRETVLKSLGIVFSYFNYRCIVAFFR